ncbi:class I SAM-dependent methyltransferase [Sinimarinibacterium thermocellulolyticum]|uniref:Class I SAM-dependent methyltransferase n=1 Tax=Sinimarinibacterium thermocellulolyticum TaxID=3170016 RepID=A0ABV2A9P8_9GAMM
MKAYDQQTVDNPAWVKRFSHRRRFEVAARLLSPRAGEAVLDYGTGDGYLIALLAERQPQARYLAFEPVAEMRAQAQVLWSRAGIAPELYARREALRGVTVDKLACMEVMEHLDAPLLAQAFADFRLLLRPHGLLMLSVPIETGATALAKNAVRAALGQRFVNASFGNVLRASFGRARHIVRPSRDGYIETHVGFDHRALAARLPDEGFVIERVLYAPLPRLGGLLNSQVFWVCRRTQT